MVREIKNKVTILHTAEDSIGIANKHGCKGIVSFFDKYRVQIALGHNKKKFLIGTFDTLEEAKKARHIADEKKREGCLEEWLATKPHGNSEECKEWWKIQLEWMDQNENNRRSY